MSPRPPSSDHSGALVLALLAVAAFSGWYLMVHDKPNETEPLAVIQKPIMPPTTTELSIDLPGHTHYTILGPQMPHAEAPKQVSEAP